VLRHLASAPVVAVFMVGVGAAGFAQASSVQRPRVTDRCPLGALPLRPADLAALRRFGLTIAPHGVEHVKGLPHPIDYRDARATAKIGTFTRATRNSTAHAVLLPASSPGQPTSPSDTRT
jgi:hypothetical protein